MCFSPIRYLLEPLQLLPVGATSYRTGFAPARNNTPFHGTLTAAGYNRLPSLRRSVSRTSENTLVFLR